MRTRQRPGTSQGKRRSSRLAAALVYAMTSLAQAQSPPVAATAVAPGVHQLSDGGRPIEAYELAVLAVAASSQVRAERTSVEAAEARRAEARVDWWPRLTFTGRYTRYSPYEQASLGSSVVAPGAPEGPLAVGAPLAVAEGAFPAIVNNYLFQASLLVPVSDYVFRVSQQVEAAETSAKAAEFLVDAQVQRVAQRVGLLYYAWARSRAAHDVAEQSEQDAERRLTLVQELVDVGKTSGGDLLVARARLAAAHRLSTDAALSVVRIERDLHTLARSDPEEVWTLSPRLGGALPPAELPAVSSLVAQATKARRELMAYDARVRTVGAQKRVIAARGMPRLDLFGNAYYANPNMRYLPPEEEWRATWDVGVQLTFSPNDLVRAQKAQRTLDSDAERSRADRSAMLDAIELEIHEAVGAIQQADAAVIASDAEVVAATEAYRARQESFEAGKGTLTEALDAESALLVARFARQEALMRQRSSRLQLAFALGQDLREQKNWP